MIERLEIFEEDDQFIIAWDDDGCPGLILGDAPRNPLADHDAATMAARLTSGCTTRKDGTLSWDTITGARKALRTARTAAKLSKSDKVDAWPEWAVMARAEGWLPPNGWKP